MTEGIEESREFISTARSLAIPENRWANPVVRQFIDFVTRVESLQEDLSRAETLAPDRFSRPLAEERKLLDSPSLQQSLKQRYSAAELLLRATRMILVMDLGKHYQANPRGFIASKINAALREYGYYVEKQES